jgi:hypothetical protein
MYIDDGLKNFITCLLTILNIILILGIAFGESNQIVRVSVVEGLVFLVTVFWMIISYSNPGLIWYSIKQIFKKGSL